jgi:hypothetical protein
MRPDTGQVVGATPVAHWARLISKQRLGGTVEAQDARTAVGICTIPGNGSCNARRTAAHGCTTVWERRVEAVQGMRVDSATMNQKFQ